MTDPEIATTGRLAPDDAPRTAPIAAAGVLVATGAASGVTVTMPRSGDPRETVELVERVAAELGLTSRIELAPRALTVRLMPPEPTMGEPISTLLGGGDIAFQKAQPVLAAMGKTIVHAGSAGAGQAAKICNNMMLGVSMIAVCEAFSLAAKLGLDAQKLFDIASQSSGQCWAMTKYCPVPGPVPTSPANRDYQPGFTAAMMLKDLLLAQAAAKSTGAKAPMAAGAAALYDLFVDQGHGGMDFSGIIKLLDHE